MLPWIYINRLKGICKFGICGSKGNTQGVALVCDRLFIDGKEIRAADVVLGRSQNCQTLPSRGRQQRYASPRRGVQARISTSNVNVNRTSPVRSTTSTRL